MERVLGVDTAESGFARSSSSVGVDASRRREVLRSRVLRRSKNSGGAPRAVIACVVRNTGLPWWPFPSLIGLPGAPSGRRSLIAFGTRNMQLSHDSVSESELTLNLLTELRALCDLGGLDGALWSGKYGLCEAPRGLVGGESNGDNSGA